MSVGPSSLRRTPVQERSAARVQRVLDTTADLIDEMGYEELTTTLVAHRAGVSVGSLYRFFPDKRALVQALTQRHMARFVQRISVPFSNPDLAHWWDAVDAVIDVYVGMHREERGFRGLHFGDVVDEHLLAPDASNNAVLAQQIARLLAERLHVVVDADLTFRLQASIEMGDALLRWAFNVEPDGNPRIIEETKTIVHDYLARHLGSSPNR
jgi:AcrR family transcriptional regulator